MTQRLAVLLLTSFVLFACSGEPSNDSGKQTRKGKDRGTATMTIGGSQWTAERAKAKHTGGKLTISASNMDMTDGKVKRQELQLAIADFKGAGDYKTGITGSRFIGVGFDVEAAKEADKSDEAATKEVTNAVTGAKHLMLSNAEVTITAVSDTEISGSFSWQPHASTKQPAITNGTFRALVSSK